MGARRLACLALVLTLLLAGCSSREKVWVSCQDRGCPLCRGEGSYQCARCGSGEWAGKRQCPRCARGTARDVHGATIACTTCGGTGKVPCQDCDGTGRIKHGEWQ